MDFEVGLILIAATTFTYSPSDPDNPLSELNNFGIVRK
jgi:hypothetical protein